MSKNKILIVDDDDDIRHLLKYNLEKSGFITNVAANGLECLEMVKSYNPDLILLDVMMPGMDGIERFVKELNQIHRIKISSYVF